MNERKPSQGPSSRLGRLTPRDIQGASANSAAYTRFVVWMRLLLPVFVVIILAALFFWPKLNVGKLAEKAVEKIPNLMVERLNLTGVDPKNRAYSLTADRALQAGSLKNVIDLENPEAELILDKGDWLMGHATQGRLDQTNKTLLLNGNVEIFHNEGYGFFTDEMHVDMNKALVWGEKNVLFQGSFGEIRGQGFRVQNSGDQILITGPASARLHLHAVTPSDKPSVNHSPSR